MPKKLDLAGKTFGRLTAIEETDQRKNGKVVWLCSCDCGNEILVRGSDLTSFHARSCGCYKRERAIETNQTHGEAGNNRTRLYSVWATMIRRCSDKTQKNYGGRGIKVCPEWKDFILFRDWAVNHPTYEEGKQIDRIDNDGDYTPENCRWVTHKDNLRNTRRTRWETIDEETKSLAEWCEIYNMPYSVVHQRLSSGWDIVDALTQPVKKNVKTKK